MLIRLRNKLEPILNLYHLLNLTLSLTFVLAKLTPLCYLIFNGDNQCSFTTVILYFINYICLFIFDYCSVEYLISHNFQINSVILNKTFLF